MATFTTYTSTKKPITAMNQDILGTTYKSLSVVGHEADSEDNTVDISAIYESQPILEYINVSLDVASSTPYIIDISVNNASSRYVAVVDYPSYIAYGGGFVYGSSVYLFLKPVGYTETPIAITQTNSYVVILTPGSNSSETAKLYLYSLAGVYSTTIELDTSGIPITDAVSVTKDASNNIWIITNESPSRLIKVWYAAPVWRYTVTTLAP